MTNIVKGKSIMADSMRYGSRFYYQGMLCQHDGWFSAVHHIFGVLLRTEKPIAVSHSAMVDLCEEVYFDGLGI